MTFSIIRMSILSLVNQFHINASMVLMRVDYLYMENYIRPIRNISLRHIILSLLYLQLCPNAAYGGCSCVIDMLLIVLGFIYIYTYIYIYIYIYI